MRVPGVKRISGGRWRRRLLAGLALAVAAAVVIVVVLNASSSSPSAASNASKTSGATAVERRSLTETDTESGTLSYNRPQTVYNRLSGTITWLPQVGQEIKPGQTLYKVDGEPVLLMNGTTPSYRDLSPSDSDGADIEQLNRNLVRLGFNAANITVDDVWQAATTEGVDLLQESLGETETGILSLGEIVFLPGDQLVTTVDGTLGSTGGSGGTSASATVDPPAAEFVSYEMPHTVSDTRSPRKATTTPSCPSTTNGTTPTTSTSTTPTTPTNTTPTTGTEDSSQHSSSCKPKKSGKPTSRQELQALLALLKAETAQLKAEEHGNSPGGSAGGHPTGSGSGNGSGNGSGSGSGNGSGAGSGGGSGSGSGSGSATAILQTTSTQLVVTVNLSASVQSEAVVGEHVTVEMPNNTLVNGKITAVSSVAQSSNNNGNGNGNGNNGGGGGGAGSNGNGNGNGSSSTIPVTIALSGHISGAGLDQAAVSVNFVEDKASNVLSVPVTALLATGGGNYAVQAAAAPHQLIPVTTGLFAAGSVEVSGSGIYPGLEVTDSQG